MALIRDVRETTHQRIQSDPEFTTALLEEAISLFLNGEPETARVILHDLVEVTIGFSHGFQGWTLGVYR